MDFVSATGNTNYVDMLQQATRRNTLQQVTDARQSGQPVDLDSVQLSNQALRDSARETGVELYSQQLVKSSFETYANLADNGSSSSTSSSSTSSSSNSSENDSNTVFTFDASQVNDLLQTTQRRALGVEMYENLQQSRENMDGFAPSLPPKVDLYT